MNAVRLSPPTGSRHTASLMRVVTSRLRLEMATWVAAQPASRLVAIRRTRRSRNGAGRGKLPEVTPANKAGRTAMPA